jgi:hypothetical protein
MVLEVLDHHRHQHHFWRLQGRTVFDGLTEALIQLVQDYKDGYNLAGILGDSAEGGCVNLTLQTDSSDTQQAIRYVEYER